MYPTHFPFLVPEEKRVINVMLVYKEDSVRDLGNCRSINQLSGLLGKSVVTIIKGRISVYLGRVSIGSAKGSPAFQMSSSSLKGLANI